MDRLIALVLLRWRLEMRALGVARERAVALAVVLPGMLFFSAIGAVVLLLAVRSLAVLRSGAAAARALGARHAGRPLLDGLAAGLRAGHRGDA